jgi:hypothetical protein
MNLASQRGDRDREQLEALGVEIEHHVHAIQSLDR